MRHAAVTTRMRAEAVKSTDFGPHQHPWLLQEIPEAFRHSGSKALSGCAKRQCGSTNLLAQGVGDVQVRPEATWAGGTLQAHKAGRVSSTT